LVSEEAAKTLQSSLDCTELEPAWLPSTELLETDSDTPPSLRLDIGLPDPSSIFIWGIGSGCPVAKHKLSLGTAFGRCSIAGGVWMLPTGRSDSETEDEEADRAAGQGTRGLASELATCGD